MTDKPNEPKTTRGWHKRSVRWAVQAVFLFGLWLALSGKTDVFFLAAGAISSVFVLFVVERLFHPNVSAGFATPPHSTRWLVKSVAQFVVLSPLMIWEILLSNLHVMRLILDPKLPIDPSMVEFQSPLTSEAANALLAQSISLTPGTITVDMSRQRFLVHCISHESRKGIETGLLLRRVAKVYDEESLEVPTVREVKGPEEVTW